MLTYSQSTGILWDDSGVILDRGYSGSCAAKNNPSRERERDLGPIPRGLYVIGAPYNSGNVGKYALPLIPSGHNAHGRTHFLIHGDSVSEPGSASKGCMIFNRATREKIWADQDLILRVIA